jgi:hypothetical protein
MFTDTHNKTLEKVTCVALTHLGLLPIYSPLNSSSTKDVGNINYPTDNALYFFVGFKTGYLDNEIPNLA